MKIDLSCPVELWHFKLPTAQYPVVSLNLFNLSEKAVTSLQAAFLSFDGEGNQYARQVERIQGVSGEPRSAFEVLAAVEDGERAARMDFIIEKVWFDDGTVWRRGAGGMSEYELKALEPSRQLDVLKGMAGSDAVAYPSDQGAVWVCVCGRPNAASAAACQRCGRDKHEQFTRYNKAVIETVIYRLDSEMEDKAHRARAEAGRMQEEREERELRHRRRVRRVLITLASVLMLAAGAWAVVTYGIPAYKYYQAGQMMERGEFDEAKAMYRELETYRDSGELAREADYRKAAGFMATGNATALRSAEDLYQLLGAYRDSGEKLSQARYRRAGLLEEAGDFDQAIALFQELGSHADSAARAKDAQYNWGRRLMEELSWGEAREKLLALGGYQDAGELADDCLYLPALDHLQAGEYALAEGLLQQLPERQAARLKLQETYYAWGGMLFSAKEYEQAAEKFLAAGDYLDAFRRASECLYEPALILMQAGDFAGAKANFDQILAYQDSALLSQQCSYQLGLLAMAEEKWDEAAEHLSLAPDVAEAPLKLREANYNLAELALSSGDLQAAAGLFDGAAGYEDAADRALQARYDLGIQLANAGDYEGAAGVFALIPDHPGAGEELKRAEYNRAIALLDKGENEAAVQAFTALDGFGQSAEYLKKALYQMAVSRQESGDHDGAAGLYQSLKGYLDADARFMEMRHQLAIKALNDGDLESAITQLGEIRGYGNAEELYLSAVYQQAGAREAAGDLDEAARLYALIPEYQDAAARRDTNYDAYYESAYETAMEAMKDKDYKLAIDALSGLDREEPGEKYAYIGEMYREANYRYADQLYEEQKPYEALVYYRNVLDYRDVSTKKLKRVAYEIIGKWESTKGAVFIFRDDGTCSMEGKEMYYYARTYSLLVGDRPDELDILYNIVDLRAKSLSLRHEDTGKLFKCARVEE